MRGKPDNLEGRKYADLSITGPPKRWNKSKNRFWTARCLRPIHGEAVVTRQVTANQLKGKTVVACIACMKADRLGKPRLKAGMIQPAPTPSQIAPPRECTRFLCRLPFHSVECEKLHLFAGYNQRDPGDGVYKSHPRPH